MAVIAPYVVDGAVMVVVIIENKEETGHMTLKYG
jgi:hypothetical protein